MDVKLVLGPRLTGIDGENDAVMRDRLLPRASEELAGVPGVLEIIWRVQSLKRRILNADNSSSGRQNEIGRAKGRPQDDVAALGSVGYVHLEAWEGHAGQRMAENTGLNDLPQRAATGVGDRPLPRTGECRADAEQRDTF